jgi:TolB-like protein/tetratricopeptide (TPR) repeat protein
MSEDQGNEYFSDGLTEELINALVKIPDLHVAARTSAFQFKGKTGDIASIGHQLKVARILEGSVRKAGNRVRITAQLIDVSNGFHLWSETYDRDIEDIFAVQDEISQSVVAALKVVLLTNSGRTGQAAPRNIEVHNLILEGKHFSRQGMAKENLAKALNCFKRALKIDSESAPAWMGLARANGGLVGVGDLSPSEYIDKARDAVERALALDDSMAEAHCMSGRLKQHHDLDWHGADAEYRRALELEPGNANLIRFAGRLAYATGRLDEAISLLSRGAKLDPLNGPLFLDLGWSLLCSGQLKEAATAYRRGLELEPARISGHHFMGRVYLLEGQPELALEEMRQEPDKMWRLEGFALAYHSLGQQEQADEALSKLLDPSSGWEFNIAEVYAFWGDVDNAFEWLERARAERDGGVGQFTKTDPLLRNLHSDPRWNKFLAKIGLAD